MYDSYMLRISIGVLLDLEQCRHSGISGFTNPRHVTATEVLAPNSRVTTEPLGEVSIYMMLDDCYTLASRSTQIGVVTWRQMVINLVSSRFIN